MKGDIQVAAFAGNTGDGSWYLNGLDNAKSYVVLSLILVVSTDANVGNRQQGLTVSANGQAVARWLSASTQAASLSRTWALTRGNIVGAAGPASATLLTEGIPELIIPAGTGRLEWQQQGGFAADALLGRAVVMEL